MGAAVWSSVPLPAVASRVSCAVAGHSVFFLVLEAGTFPLIKFEAAKTKSLGSSAHV